MKRHIRTFILYFVVFGAVWVGLAWLGTMYPPLDPDVLVSKQTAQRARDYILSFGPLAPVVFVAIQIVQVVCAPIPGQAAAFMGGFIFGWRLGVAYTMLGLFLGSWLAMALSRRYGRRLVERINGKEAVDEFEEILLRKRPTAARVLERTTNAVRHNPLLTFFIMMVLPGLPDDLICFVAGLSNLPIKRLLPLAIIGRFPANLGLALLGEGFTGADSNRTFWILMGTSIAIGGVYAGVPTVGPNPSRKDGASIAFGIHIHRAGVGDVAVASRGNPISEGCQVVCTSQYSVFQRVTGIVPRRGPPQNKFTIKVRTSANAQE